MQLNHYYPFGGLFGESMGGSAQKHKYGGKELDRMYGLDCYDFSTRSYDPVLGRFFSQDAMREKYYPLSPYTYCGNNPVNRTDPSGMDWYGDGTGALWFDGSVYAHRIGGVNYYNMGSTLSCTMAHGSYLNYYQNVLVSISNIQGDAYSTILDSPKLQIDLLGNGSPLSTGSQTGLLSSLMNSDRNEFAKDAMEVSMCAMMAMDGVGLAQVAYNLGGLGVKAVAKMFAKNATKAVSKVTPKIAFRSFTSSNFRYNLGKLTNGVKKGYQAHHVFPQKHRTEFMKKGIDIDNPKYGAWWETHGHLSNAKAYNNRWDSFDFNKKTSSEIIDFGRTSMNKYNVPTNF